YLDKEAAERLVAQLTAERAAQREERLRLAKLAQTVRSEWREQQEQAHARELEVNDFKHRRDTLCDRLREDYQLELAELDQSQIADWRLQNEERNLQSPIGNLQSIDAAAANEEIAELRRKLSRLGAVNLDALQELTELEQRAAVLRTQHDDLTSAK